MSFEAVFEESGGRLRSFAKPEADFKRFAKRGVCVAKFHSQGAFEKRAAMRAKLPIMRERRGTPLAS